MRRLLSTTFQSEGSTDDGIDSAHRQLVKLRVIPLLSPVHTSDNVEATLSNATSRTILSTKSNVASTLLPFFDNNVAGFGNNVDRNFVLSTKSKQIKHILNMFNYISLRVRWGKHRTTPSPFCLKTPYFRRRGPHIACKY